MDVGGVRHVSAHDHCESYKPIKISNGNLTRVTTRGSIAGYWFLS